MIAKVLLFCFVVAAAHAIALLGSGIVSPALLNSAVVAPGLLNSGIIAPGLLNSAIMAPGVGLRGVPLLSAALPPAVSTSSVVATPGAITTDRRVIGATGLLTGAPLVYSNGIIGNGLIAGSPLALGRGIISPIGLRSAGILAGPGVVKTLLK